MVDTQQRNGTQPRKSQKLMTASVINSYDPNVDIDWDAPLVEGKWFLSERFCSLAGTDLWDSLTFEQKVICSREELAGSLGSGVWTEHMLLALVSRYVYDRPITDPDVQFALTEIADECRHMIMFAKTLDAIGAEPYRAPWQIRHVGRPLKKAAPLIVLWAMLLMTEEIFEQIQREVAKDESVQPVVRTMSRIHVVEESRHIGFARAELDRLVPQLSKPQLSALRTMLATSAPLFIDGLFSPEMYRRSGLDPKVARAAAKKNKEFRETFKWAASRVTDHYRSIGLIGGASERVWRRAGVI
ncbi:P-aminobenzoate N-oxygenase AurF-like protein [Nocardia nova SH22a]|uniref:p-aminobenzoate N-oxygenase AurF-like protein n=1 Tax=Nocardia nova SH22a TaxID=1415166 RepID=W5TDZ2_9NOCA|nr:diiron oxygenase [Nocardia nova]AHH15456.1 P-aminobenzoate N-oxygenase AurF-like protein [Nocardia nova SH22a]